MSWFEKVKERSKAHRPEWDYCPNTFLEARTDRVNLVKTCYHVVCHTLIPQEFRAGRLRAKTRNHEHPTE